MNRRVLTAAVGLATFFAAFDGNVARAATIEILPIFGEAFGVDGQNVVGRSGSVGFLYDGNDFTVIQVPSGGTTQAKGISGDDIVGFFADATGIHGFHFDGTSYTTLDHPLAGTRTVAEGIFGNNIVGWYEDASNEIHGFLYDGTTWTTLDHPSGGGTTIARGIDGNNIVGSYVTMPGPLGRTRGFVYDGTTWTTLNDPAANGGTTVAYDIDGSTVVGFYSAPLSRFGFVYDGSTFMHPSIGQSSSVFTGISGNTIVGHFRDGPTGLNRPFIYSIPEPSSITLASIAGIVVLVQVGRARASRRRAHKRAG